MPDPKSDNATTPNLGALQDTYEIVGELRGSQCQRPFLARRKDNGADVVITVHTPPKGGDGKELPHFAADVQMLAGLRHPHVVPVHEARWVGKGELAVVSDRVGGDTLAELVARGQTFGNPRVAAVLHEVLGVLDWARTRGIVHRGVSADCLFFEEDTERVLVSLLPAPIPITGVADERTDAKTIGELAWIMLTGKELPETSGETGLAELAPNLALRVVEATEKLLRGPDGRDTPVPDVSAVLAIIAAGDVLKQVEVEMAAMKEEYEEQHRAELAKCELQREEVEQRAVEEATALADERAAFEKKIADMQAALSDERADFERIIAERTEHLATVRATLEQQAADLEKRLADFDARRTAFESVVLEKQKQVAADPELPVLEEVTVDADDTPPADLRGMFDPLDAKPAEKPKDKTRPRWMVPATVAGVVVALSAAIAGARYENQGRHLPTPTKTVQAPIPEGGSRRGGFLSQTAAGTLAPKSLGSVQPFATAADSAARAAAPATTDSVAPTPAVVNEEPRPRPRPKPVVRDTVPSEPASIFSLPPRRTTTDTIRRDTIRPDSIRRDSVRRDSIRPDTLVKRDSLGVPIDTTRLVR
jgi:chemotaxis protein histidine kinase CheA